MYRNRILRDSQSFLHQFETDATSGNLTTPTSGEHGTQLRAFTGHCLDAALCTKIRLKKWVPSAMSPGNHVMLEPCLAIKMKYTSITSITSFEREDDFERYLPGHSMSSQCTHTKKIYKRSVRARYGPGRTRLRIKAPGLWPGLLKQITLRREIA
ncbi:hypothetical protein B0H11DRAFT_1909160 [Mycena galericulata]|nr:hypothetical protein B0H11DRAFT_1909160 [Mycena galericulata]